ncbi:hypothetical protein IGI04_032129 [Brassica rapa subsp. trilocularis]|uniref:Uncharacterized protein n=1 Tax=Brassica rapa subsp. trilocularis TaxID=1813537 RepID=A0ABQ7LVK9_BRACM|nr:hypothetical protein IGI04_032129 [Brassica rapa subsp. trilocularis]
MSVISDLTEKANDKLKILEDLTSNVKQIQDNVLEEILTLNTNTEYLQRFFHGKFDKEIFKKNVPVVTYEDVKPYIQRVANGGPSNVISTRPITGFLLSSGTSGGAQKIMPWNEKFLDYLTFMYDLRMHVITNYVKGLEKGKAMMFYFTKLESITPSGLPARTASSSYLKSSYFKNRPCNWYYTYTSPDEVILCPDNKQSLYCHLICGLVQRNEVTRMGSIFASVMVRAIKSLEDSWEELCSNIRSGQLSEWITDPGCRDSVSMVLGGPHPEVANTVEKICNEKCWKGIFKRLWPRTKYIETIVTGSMAQYVPTLNYYCNDMLPLVSTIYASSETTFGLNLNPLCKPEDVSYTIMPNVSYFEFIPLDGDENDVVDLADLKLGCSYELVVTNFSGLYRIRVGDILLVTGFYNKAPQLRFIRRDNMVLSIDMDKTNEEDLFNAVTRAKIIINSSGLMLTDFTSYADVSTIPGHYVIYWEVEDKREDKTKHMELKEDTFSECCLVMEDSFDNVYKRCRFREKTVGPLEIKVVRYGTFDSLTDFFISQGASIGQYKTPRCIGSGKPLELLEKSVVATFFSTGDCSFKN